MMLGIDPNSIQYNEIREDGTFSKIQIKKEKS